METETATVFVRTMRKDDIEEVSHIDQLSFSLPWPERAYHHEIEANRSSLSWVAEVDQGGGERKVVGLVVVWLVLDEAHIATIAVHPDYRSQGIGKRLLLTALRGAANKGASRVMLEVRASNEVARRLYRRFGFKVVGRRPRYYRDNKEDAVLMNLDILDESYMKELREIPNGMQEKA